MVTSTKNMNPTLKGLTINCTRSIRPDVVKNLFIGCECLFLLWAGEDWWQATYWSAFKYNDIYFTFITYSCSNSGGSDEIDNNGGLDNWIANILPTKIEWYQNMDELVEAVKNFDIKTKKAYEESECVVNKLNVDFLI